MRDFKRIPFRTDGVATRFLTKLIRQEKIIFRSFTFSLPLCFKVDIYFCLLGKYIFETLIKLLACCEQNPKRKYMLLLP